MVRRMEDSKLLATVSDDTGTEIPPKESRNATSNGKPKLDKSERAQSQRKKLIDDLISKGVFQKVEVPGSAPRVWVKPLFYESDFDQKEAFVGLVYSYYFDGSDELAFVRVLDSRSNKEVGTYSQVNNWGRGGLKMK